MARADEELTRHWEVTTGCRSQGSHEGLRLGKAAIDKPNRASIVDESDAFDTSITKLVIGRQEQNHKK